jgi:ubiquinol-cytochrome c reductase core subunit 2
MAVVANGADQAELSKWVNEYFGGIRTDAASGIPPIKIEQTKYYGGEERISHGGGNTMILAFPGSSSLTGGFYKPEVAVLSAILGGQSTIKWSPGFSLLGKVSGNNPSVDITTHSAIYSDAGLLYTQLHGSATAVRDAAYEVVKAIKDLASGSIDKEVFEKARALAKFKELEYGQNAMAALELTGAGLVQDSKPYQLDESAQKIGEVTIEKVQEVCSSMMMF